jgi:hypothetical protein
VRAANVCRLQENTRDGRRCWAERASTSRRDGRVLIRQTRGGINFHPSRLFPVCSSFFFALTLCTEHWCGLLGTFLLSLLLTSPLFSLSFFFPFQRGTTIPAPPMVFFTIHTTSLDPGARSLGGQSLLREQNTTTYIPHSLLAGPAA